MSDHVVGVDVGTRSARAGVFDTRGALKARAERPIQLRRDGPDIFEQDSEDIWRGVCDAVRAAVSESGIDPLAVRGIGFDATCSLVARDASGGQVAVGRDGVDSWDTILWMDHRAIEEARELAEFTETKRAADARSPEMQAPKAMWLKRHLPQSWSRIGMLFDLVDFLTWKASGSLARSHCALACKWPYRSEVPSGWRHNLLAQVDLGDLLAMGGMPETATPPGADLGPLSAEAANALGLGPRCRVAAGLVDAHAGTLAVLGGHTAQSGADGRAALITGTSNSVMFLARNHFEVPDMWGPYFGAVVPEFWMIEGGQSASGALLDHIISSHPAGGLTTASLRTDIEARIGELLARDGPELAADLIVLPDFHGNRTPFGDPRGRGAIVGMTLDDSFDGLCRLYWRTAVGVALGVRTIVEAFEKSGVRVGTLHLAGGQAASSLLPKLYSDATGRAIETTVAPDSTLLGAAMTGATAAGLYTDLTDAAVAMEQPLSARNEPDPTDPYRGSYDAFRALQAHLRSRGAQTTAIGR